MARRPARPPAAPPRRRPLPHSALATALANALDELAVSAALNVDAHWYPIHQVPSVLGFEIEHAADSRRWAYNRACFERVRRERRLVVGEHAGFHDLFVPVGPADQPWGTLVAGPVARQRPSAALLQAQWQAMTGSKGRLTDTGFAHYVSAALTTLTLEPGLFRDLERLLSCMAALLGGQGRPGELFSEGALLRSKLIRGRLAERMWEATRDMVDERSARTWSRVASAQQLSSLGVKHVPEHVVVGLLVGRQGDVDPVEDLVRRDALQRDCVALAQRNGVLAGRVGEHGVVLLADASGPPARKRRKLSDLGQRAAELAAQRGLKLHLGLSDVERSAPLPLRYWAALAAAERALVSAVPLLHAEQSTPPGAGKLHELRRQLGRATEERALLLAPRFERYFEAVATHTGYRAEPARAHLEAGFERLSESLLESGALEQKSLDELWRILERELSGATTVGELGGVFRKLVADLERAMLHPSAGRQARGMRRALGHVNQHLGKRLSRDAVARLAGFAPSYFSKLFKREQGSSFEDYVKAQRLERAKQLLLSSSLGVENIAARTGFGTRNYFHEAFKAAFGAAPVAYRKRHRLERAKEMLLVTADAVEHVAERTGFDSLDELTRTFRRELGVSPETFRQNAREPAPAAPKPKLRKRIR